MMSHEHDAWQDAQEDYAIGAEFAVPDPSLSEEYRNAYVESWQQCKRMARALDLETDEAP
jgi:hypothetical protein